MSVQHSAGEQLRVGSCGQGVPRVSRKVQTRIMLDAIVSNKTFGNATFRQFVTRGFQNFKRLAFRRMFFEKKSAPCHCDALGLTDSHAKRNHFPRNFRTVPVVVMVVMVVMGFFSATGDLPPQPERVHSPAKDAFQPRPRDGGPFLGEWRYLRHISPQPSRAMTLKSGLFFSFLLPINFFLSRPPVRSPLVALK